MNNKIMSLTKNKINNPEKFNVQANIIPSPSTQLNQEQIDLLNFWHDSALEGIADKVANRLRTMDKKRGLWAGDNIDAWRNNPRATALGLYTIAVAEGKRIKEALKLASFETYGEYVALSYYSTWGKMAKMAREAQIDLMAERARERLDRNLQEGIDGGTKSATYILDWYRKTAQKDERTTEGGKVNQSGIIYNINISPPKTEQICQNVKVLEAIIDNDADQ